MYPDDIGRVSDAHRDISSLQKTIDDLQRRVEKQAILLRALFLLLRDSAGLTEKRLLDRFRQCEADRANAPTKRCSGCGRPVSLRHNRCLYCDEACIVQSAFELLDAGVWPDQAPQPGAKEPHKPAKPPTDEGITILDD